MKPRDFRPDLLPKIRDLEIEAKQQVLSAMLSGEWISRVRGHGIEFAGYRAYTSGDDASLIDWKASLRSRKLVIKEMQEEKSLSVYLFLDVSDTMIFGTTDKIKAEYAAEVTSSLAFAALHSGENVALAMWSEGVRKFLPLGSGLRYHSQLLRILGDINNYGGEKNIDHAGKQMLAMMRQPGLVVLISDFVGFDAKWEKYTKIFATEHDLLAVVIRDARDRRLPEKGEYLVEDPSSGQKLLIDAVDYREPYAHYVEEEESRIHQIVTAAGGDLILLETTDNYKDVITKAISQRKERWWH